MQGGFTRNELLISLETIEHRTISLTKPLETANDSLGAVNQ